MTKPPSPGIFSGVPFADYIEWDAVNNSSLSHLSRSPRHYAHSRATPSTSSDALKFGTLVHAGKFEPVTLASQYVVMPDFSNRVRTADGTAPKNPKATKQYKDLVAEFERVNDGKEIVSRDWYDKTLRMLESLNESKRAREWFGANGTSPEVSMVWEDTETGLLCKGRMDCWCGLDRYICDLKTVRDAADFSASIASWGYHRQAAFYLDGIRTLTGDEHVFRIVAIEKEEPFGVRAAELSFDAAVAGRYEYRRLLRRLAECRAKDVWPGYEDPPEWDIPRWKLPEVCLVVGGESVAL